MNIEHPTQEQLVDYIHRELAPADDAYILMHLESCDTCRARYEGETRLTESLRAYGRATEHDMPAGVAHRIWDAIDAPAQPAWMTQLRALLRPAIALPVAAAIILALYFGVGTNHGTTLTMIDASYYLDDHAALTSTVPFGEGNAVPAQLENDQVGTAVQSVAVETTTFTTANAAR